MFNIGNTYRGMTSSFNGWQLKPGADDLEIALFSEPELVPTKLEDGGSDGEGPSEHVKEDSQFKTYLPLTHMHNVDLSTKDGLEFAEFPHRRPSYTSSSLNSSDLEVGRSFPLKMVLSL
ncbi:hypothetical protein J1N35_044715 [Gossypium stocksii]|uniref:Uncharacterized protein n=1 Tax=Gossypium stocksii TaxID=47602 RepID=A0A9D3ZGD1_9ROSI|nr:hypothetical protein J1N35_044715 [Gossypium stocksii]